MQRAVLFPMLLGIDPVKAQSKRRTSSKNAAEEENKLRCLDPTSIVLKDNGNILREDITDTSSGMVPFKPLRADDNAETRGN